MIIPEFFAQRVDAGGDKPFLHFGERVISFAEMNARSDRVAVFLRDIGVRKGDKVCLLLSNRPEYIELWLGLAKLGAVMVPLSTTLKAEGLAYIINHSDSIAIALDEALAPTFRQAEPMLPSLRWKLWVGSEAKLPDGFIQYDRGVEGAPSARLRTPRVAPSDLMSIIYTSTGGGLPRGAMIPHFNYINTGRTWAEHVIQAGPGDVFFTSIPLFNMNPQATTIMGSVSSGCRMVLIEQFVASRFFDEIRRYGATVFSYVGWMLASLMSQPRRPDDAQGCARLAFGGAAPKEIWRSFEERFGVTLLEGYGRAETGLLCLVNPLEGITVGSVGKPLPFCEVKILDESGREPPAGTPGEIVIREATPHTMFSGYYKARDLTGEVVRDGWFHSGDCGYVDEESYFHYLDRMKDCIRMRDTIIPSFEIEHVVNMHPAVIESATVGVTSEPGVEDIRVFVVVKENGLVSPEEIVDWCSRRLASFMVPRFVEFIGELPKSMTQRIKKDVLRNRPLDGCWDGRQKEMFL